MKRLLLAAAAIVAAIPANASLSLTGDGITDGFTLSTFFSGSTTGGYADIANAPLGDGTLVGIDEAQGRLYKFADVDGQTFASALAPSPASLPGVINVARVGGVTYASILGGGYFSIANNLATTPVPVAGVLAGAGYGLWANPVTGHLIGAGGGGGIGGLYDIDPVAGTSRLIDSGFFDGVTVSADGKTAYGYLIGTDQIVGVDIASATRVYTSPVLPGPPDGTGVISGGTFDGEIIVNNNDGTVGLLDPTGTHAYSIIASGGSRGDFASADPSNGTLFLSEIDVNYRLGIEGGTIGGTPAPEPASLTLLGAALAGLGFLRRRRR